MTDAWKAYYPDDDETSDDARILTTPPWKRICDADDAACIACEYDYDQQDGWERTKGEPFPIVVIAPDGTETRWKAYHEPSVEHIVEEVE